MESMFCCRLGEGGAAREHKTSFHALRAIAQKEGPAGVYAGYVFVFEAPRIQVGFVYVTEEYFIV